MKSKHRPLIIGVATLAAFDLAGIITMVANPDLTARVIPALVGVQILGFIVIAVIVVTSRRDGISAEGVDGETGGTSRQWIPWLFGFLALVSFVRVGLSILYIAGETWHRYSWVAPTAGAAMGCFFLWLAFVAGRSKQGAKGRTGNANSDL